MKAAETRDADVLWVLDVGGEGTTAEVASRLGATRWADEALSWEGFSGEVLHYRAENLTRGVLQRLCHQGKVGHRRVKLHNGRWGYVWMRVAQPLTGEIAQLDEQFNDELPLGLA